MKQLVTLLTGANAASYVVAALFFLRFWIRARDPLFLSFATAFSLLAINQVLTGLTGSLEEQHPSFYLLRLLGFLLIIAAIVRKNLGRR